MAGQGHVLKLLTDQQMSPVPALLLETANNDTMSVIADEVAFNPRGLVQEAEQLVGRRMKARFSLFQPVVIMEACIK